MKIIEQSFKIRKGNNTFLQQLEEAGRICYKSEDKITDDSASSFVKMIIDNGHHAMLEHSNIIVSVDKETFDIIKHLDLEDIKYMHMTSYDCRYLISGSVRAWRDLRLNVENQAICTILMKLTNTFSLIFDDLVPSYIDPYMYPGKMTIDIINVNSLTDKEKLIHMNLSVHFITDRAVANEIVRHRNCAFAQESTHYINYLNRDITFVRQAETKDSNKYDQSTYEIGIIYADNRQEKTKVRRGLLPLCFKTEIIVTASIKEWQHILNIRTTMKAHPQMRELMRGLLDQLQQELPEFFKEITYES